MPCAVTHLRLAGVIWDNWADRRLPVPFPLHNDTHQAFLHGALAPDLGFVPGVERFVSQLAHYFRPADLTRSVMSEAGTDLEAAFAWGWVTHVLGDVTLHPKVGMAVGEELFQDRTRRINAIDDVETHVSIEVGMDAQLLSRHPEVPAPPSRPFFDGTSAGLLANALRRVYGLRLSPDRLAGWHRVAVARTRRWPAALRALARSYPLISGPSGRRVSITSPVVGLGRRLSRPGSAAAGFFRPRRPAEWLMEAVDREASAFPSRLAPFLQEGLERLENRNLESGELESEDASHPETVDARRRLADLAGSAHREP